MRDPASDALRVSANTSDTLYGPAAFAELRLSPAEGLALVPSVPWTYDRWRLSGYLDVQNVYNRGNQEGWSYSYD